MATQWTTAASGIRFREHESRKHGVRLDRYYTIRLRVDGKRVEEALGWASEGWTLQRVQAELSKLKEAKRTGQGPATLSESRAQARLAKARAEKLQQETARVAVTLDEYFANSYAPWALATKPAAFEKEESHWKLWIKPELGALPIRAIGLEQWDALTKTLSKAGLSQRSLEYITGTLRRIIKHARERRIVTEAPPTGRMLGATSPKDNRRLRVLSPQELESLLSELKERDIHAWRLTRFASLTGCRAGEAFGLKWRHVDLAENKVTFTDTKNKQCRTIPIGPELANTLRDVGPGAHGDYVFTNTQGRAYKDAPRSFRAVVTSLGLNEGRSERELFTFHSLRHGFATALAKRLPLRDLMDYMGWKVAAMALRYTHGDERSQRVAVEALEKMASGERGIVLPLRQTTTG